MTDNVKYERVVTNGHVKLVVTATGSFQGTIPKHVIRAACYLDKNEPDSRTEIK